MMKLIVISGSPGTGKSTLAEALVKKFGFRRLDLHDHYQDISTGYNRAKQAYDIDLKKFLLLVKKELKSSAKTLIIDSHIAHLLPKSLVNLCIILTCSDLKKLEKRLQERKYNKRKIRENLDAEIFQVCLTEAQEQEHQPLVFDSSKLGKRKLLDEVMEDIEKKI